MRLWRMVLLAAAARCAQAQGAHPAARTVPEGKDIDMTRMSAQQVLREMQGAKDDHLVQASGCVRMASIAARDRGFPARVRALGASRSDACYPHCLHFFTVAKAAMQRFPTDAVGEGCISALMVLALDDRDNKRATVSVGLIPIICQIMRQHPSVEPIQEHGAHLLALLAAHDTAQAPTHAKLLIVNDGGLSAVAGALQRFPGHADVQKWGVAVLRNVGNQPQNRDERDAVGQVDGLSLAVVALELHPSEGALQAEGFWVLTMLSNHALEHKEAVKAAGGLELITNALKAHPDHAAVQLAAISTLSSLMGPATASLSVWDSLVRGGEADAGMVGGPLASEGSADEETRLAVLGAGGVALMVSAMTNHPRDEHVQHAGCSILGTLATSSGRARVMWPEEGEEEVTARQATQSAEGIKQVVSALAANRGAEKVVVECSRTIAELVGPSGETEVGIAREFLKVGAVRELVKSMEAYPGHGGVQGNGCLALQNLYHGGDDLAKLLLSKDAVFNACQKTAADWQYSPGAGWARMSWATQLSYTVFVIVVVAAVDKAWLKLWDFWHGGGGGGEGRPRRKDEGRKGKARKRAPNRSSHDFE